MGVLGTVMSSLACEGLKAALGTTFLGTGRLTSFICPIESTVQYIVACGRLDNSSPELDMCWKSLIELYQVGDAETLVSYHAGFLIRTLCEVRMCCPGPLYT